MLQYLVIVVILLYLQTRFWWVAAGHVAVKRCRWRLWRGSTLVVLGPGRHYLVPFLDSVVLEQGGKRCEWPAGGGRERTIENICIRTGDNVEFMLSVTYRFNVVDQDQFSAWIRGDETGGRAAGSLNLLDSVVVTAMVDTCTRFKALVQSPGAVRQVLSDGMSTQARRMQSKTGIAVHQPVFSAFKMIVDLGLEHERVQQRRPIADFLTRNAVPASGMNSPG